MTTKFSLVSTEIYQPGMMNHADDSLIERLWHELDGEVSRDQIARVAGEIAVTYLCPF